MGWRLSQLNVTIREHNELEHTIDLAVFGEVDVYTAPQLREKLLPLCQGGSSIHLDLSGVDYIDSTGLGVLIGAYKAQKSTDGKLIISGMNSRLTRLFRITGLQEIMEFGPDNQGDGKS